MDERERGVVLRLLATEELCVAVAAQAGCDLLEVAYGPYAVGVSPSGRTYVVCCEGVGWEVTADQPLSLSLYRQRTGSISLLPAYDVELSLNDVKKFTTDATIDLADLVRRFGARLEDNFHMMRRTLTVL